MEDPVGEEEELLLRQGTPASGPEAEPARQPLTLTDALVHQDRLLDHLALLRQGREELEGLWAQGTAQPELTPASRPPTQEEGRRGPKHVSVERSVLADCDSSLCPWRGMAQSLSDPSLDFPVH